jgi:hypothetical protein
MIDLYTGDEGYNKLFKNETSRNDNNISELHTQRSLEHIKFGEWLLSFNLEFSVFPFYVLLPKREHFFLFHI